MGRNNVARRATSNMVRAQGNYNLRISEITIESFSGLLRMSRKVPSRVPLLRAPLHYHPSLNPSSLTHATRCRHARARTDRGWIARTTDAVFIMKPQYVDVIFPRARTCGSPSRSRSYFFLPPGTLSIFSFTKSLALGICHPKRSRMRCPG